MITLTPVCKMMVRIGHASVLGIEQPVEGVKTVVEHIATVAKSAGINFRDGAIVPFECVIGLHRVEQHKVAPGTKHYRNQEEHKRSPNTSRNYRACTLDWNVCDCL